MGDLYGLHLVADYSHQSSSAPPLESLVFPANCQTYSTASADCSHRLPAFGSELLAPVSSAASDAALMVEIQRARAVEEESAAAIRAKIASHPLYPKLLEAFVDCQKVVFYSEKVQRSRLDSIVEECGKLILKKFVWVLISYAVQELDIDF